MTFPFIFNIMVFDYIYFKFGIEEEDYIKYAESIKYFFK